MFNTIYLYSNLLKTKTIVYVQIGPELGRELVSETNSTPKKARIRNNELKYVFMSVFQFRMYVALGFSLRLSPCRRSIMRLKMRISILLILLSILPNLSSSSSSSSNSSYFIRREGREAAVNNSINKFKLSQFVTL